MIFNFQCSQKWTNSMHFSGCGLTSSPLCNTWWKHSPSLLLFCFLSFLKSSQGPPTSSSRCRRTFPELFCWAMTIATGMGWHRITLVSVTRNMNTHTRTNLACKYGNCGVIYSLCRWHTVNESLGVFHWLDTDNMGPSKSKKYKQINQVIIPKKKCNYV